VAGYALPADDRIKNKIFDLVDDGVLSVAEMRRHITYYVRKELFARRDVSPSSDRRFFPTAVDYRNYIYRARLTKLHSKVDQVNLKLCITKWSEQFPNDQFYFREYSSQDSQQDAVSNSDDAEDADVCIQESTKGLLFCHQTQWQKHLPQRYGNEICLLDATYKTSRYALPLFFICVKTNVNYAVAASFIVQSEDSKSISVRMAPP